MLLLGDAWYDSILVGEALVVLTGKSVTIWDDDWEELRSMAQREVHGAIANDRDCTHGYPFCLVDICIKTFKIWCNSEN